MNVRDYYKAQIKRTYELRYPLDGSKGMDPMKIAIQEGIHISTLYQRINRYKKINNIT